MPRRGALAQRHDAHATWDMGAVSPCQDDSNATNRPPRPQSSELCTRRPSVVCIHYSEVISLNVDLGEVRHMQA